MLTLNANPRVGGTRIDRKKYEAVRAAMLKAVPREPARLPYKLLAEAVADRLPGGEIPGGGAILWYVTVVKLDLEARGLLRRVPGQRPMQVQRVRGAR